MTAAAYDLTRCLLFLRPGASFGTTGNDYDLTEWKGPGAMPTEAECAAAWPLVQAQLTADATNASIRDQLDALDARYGVRALTEALSGDRTRLDWLEAEKAALRAQFVGVSEIVAAPPEEA